MEMDGRELGRVRAEMDSISSPTPSSHRRKRRLQRREAVLPKITCAPVAAWATLSQPIPFSVLLNVRAGRDLRCQLGQALLGKLK